jgi:hypothetical protein
MIIVKSQGSSPGEIREGGGRKRKGMLPGISFHQCGADVMSHFRSVYERAYRSLRDTQPDAKEEAVMLLEAWRDFEANLESKAAEDRQQGVEAVERKMPKRIKVKPMLQPGIEPQSFCWRPRCRIASAPHSESYVQPSWTSQLSWLGCVQRSWDSGNMLA